MDFTLTSLYKPTGDQPEAIRQLVEGVNNADPYQTLLGVTGSGKTFTVANIIQQTQKPTLILSHNKTLAVARLYGFIYLVKQVIHLVNYRAHINHGVKQSCRAYNLLHYNTA